MLVPKKGDTLQTNQALDQQKVKDDKPNICYGCIFLVMTIAHIVHDELLLLVRQSYYQYFPFDIVNDFDVHIFGSSLEFFCIALTQNDESGPEFTSF